MKNILPFALILSITSTQGQTSFEKLYEGDGSGMLVQFKGDSILSTIGWGPSITLLDPEGSVIRTIHKWEGNTFAPWAIGKYTENIFYYAGFYHNGTCAGPDDWLDDPLICRMDSSGNAIELKKYELNGYCPGVINPEMEVGHDGDVTIWGQDQFFTLHVDSDLTPVWAKHFDHQGSFQFIRELPNGDYLAGINMDTAGAVVARMDAVGDFLWCKSYIRPRGVVQDCLIESDSSFIITGYTDNIASTNGFETLPQDYHPKLFMMKLNGTGNVQWCKGYGSEPEWYASGGRQRTVKAQDGNYVLLANIGVQDHNLPFRPFLMKTGQNGDTIWTRTAGLNPYTYTIADLLSCPSGGFAFSGAIYGDLPNSNLGLYFIFKCDSLGHLPCNEATHSATVLDLFPIDSSFTLTPVDGVTVSPTFVSDSLYPDILIYDGCTFATNLAQTVAHARPTKVHPNPSTGRFTVEFTDPLTVDSFYAVYDAVGKLLFQRPLAKGQESEEVDLSRYGKGTYLVRVTSREGVCYERVVVQ